MIEVVTNGAAFSQPFLQARKPQAFGVSSPDSPQVDLQIAAEASRQHAATATEVAQASDDRSSLKQDPNTRGGQGYQPRARANDALRDLPAVPAGPSKARVEVPPQILQAPAPQPNTPEPQAARAPEPAPAPAAPVKVAAAAPATDAPARQGPPPVDVGALNNAEQLNSVALEAVSQNIVGVAFAPVQVAATSQDGADVGQQLRQKNFIFSQRKLFAEAEQSGKFAAEENRRIVRETTHEAPKFAAETAQIVTSAVTAGKFAAETSQKVAEKFAPDQRGAGVEDITGEQRLYDKVPESQTQGRFAREDDAAAEERRASRESLYQRAAKIANALGDKSANPEVVKLFADVERYAAQLNGGPGSTSAAAVSPSVVVTA